MLHLQSLLNPVGLPLGGLFLRILAVALYIETYEIAPYEEDCPQVGGDSYLKQAKASAGALIDQLKRSFDTEGVSFDVVEVDHELGSYFEIEASASDNDVEAVMRLIHLGSNFPECWDQDSLSRLGLESKPV